MTQIQYTAQAIELNKKIQVKQVNGLRFKVSDRIGYVCGKGYGFYIEGMGFIKFKSDNTIFTLAKKSTAASVANDGFLEYDSLEFSLPM